MTGALIVATGPSLTEDDIRYWSRGRTVYAVNDAYRICPRVDLLYACDEEWYDLHESRTRRIGARWTTSDAAARKYGLGHIPGRHSDSARCYFDASGHGIVYGLNSGFQAVNLAYVLGERNAVLLGFDLGHAPGTPRHFFGEHPPEIDKPSPYAAMLEHWNRAAPEIERAGMTIFNATRGGALECFPRVTRP